MTRKERDPFCYRLIRDGSVVFAVFHPGKRAKIPRVHEIGYFRLSTDGFILANFELEAETDYSDWERFTSVQEALSSLMDVAGHDAQFACSRASHLLPKYSFRASQALVRSARLAVQAAVANMLRLSTYEDVMSAVSEAVTSQVLES